MRVAVFGAGAVGGYFGGRLAESGVDVVFIARGSTLDALRSDGLRIESPEGDVHLRRVATAEDAGRVEPVDVVMVGTKAWQVPEAAAHMRPLVGESTVVLPLQNGVEAPFQLADVLGADHVLGGLARIIAFVATPGKVRHVGGKPLIAFGELDGSQTERVQRLAALFERSRGVVAEVPNDIRLALWEKFLFIAAASGVGALTRAPFGVVRTMRETRSLFEKMLGEITAVGVAHGVDLTGDSSRRTLAFLDALPPSGIPSMQRDIAEGRPSELESQIGAVVRLGRERGVDTPVSRVIYHCLLPLERRARGEVGW